MKAVIACTLTALLLGTVTPAGAGETAAAPQPATAVAATAAKLDINRATVDELVGVPGIGPRMAQAIVEFRTTNGPFTTLEQLMQVRGIKEKTLNAIAPYFAALTQPSPPAPSR